MTPMPLGSDEVPHAPPPIAAEDLPPGMDWVKIILNTGRGMVLLLLLAFLALMFFPGIFPRVPSDEPRASEARAALGAIKDRARVVYQRTGEVPQSLDELGLGSSELSGSYFSAKDYEVEGGRGEDWSAICRDVFSSDPPELRITANFEVGSANFNR